MTVDLASATLLTKEQAAAMLAVSPRTVYRWGLEGRLEVVHLTARTLRYPEASIRRLIAAGDRPGRDLSTTTKEISRA